MDSVISASNPSKNRFLSRQKRLRRTVRFAYLRFKRIRGRPDAIARGIAMGIFTGVMPLFGIQTVFAIALTTLVRGNPLAAAAATWISNPITFIPLYTLNFRIGQQILGSQDLFLNLQSPPSFVQFLKLGFDCIATLTVGCVALGIPLALVSYLLTLSLATYWRRQGRNRNRRRQPLTR
ncbi:MAG: DUF2062 domain-containing protein [Leptolyngbyaceae cyanobacterium MO_188.B28]|nr:DUF2062 domain-containing protein [Leptolyngbyaceae cyanobacterium MO_188.B28]